MPFICSFYKHSLNIKVTLKNYLGYPSPKQYFYPLNFHDYLVHNMYALYLHFSKTYKKITNFSTSSIVFPSVIRSLVSYFSQKENKFVLFYLVYYNLYFPCKIFTLLALSFLSYYLV